MKTRLRELTVLHWAVFIATIHLTCWLIATQPDNPLPLFMLIFLVAGFVKVVNHLTEPQ
jgi:hypothetical protein